MPFKFLESMRTTITHLNSKIHEMVNYEIILNLLLQQRYLNVVELKNNGIVIAKILNIESQLELSCPLTECFRQIFNFNSEKIQKMS